MTKKVVKKAVKKPQRRKRVVDKLGVPEFLVGVSNLCFFDKSSPSLTLSFLPGERLFYASIVRYEAKFGESKRVVFSSKKPELRLAIKDCVDYWNSILPPTSSPIYF